MSEQRFNQLEQQINDMGSSFKQHLVEMDQKFEARFVEMDKKFDRFENMIADLVRMVGDNNARFLKRFDEQDAKLDILAKGLEETNLRLDVTNARIDRAFEEISASKEKLDSTDSKLDTFITRVDASLAELQTGQTVLQQRVEHLEQDRLEKTSSHAALQNERLDLNVELLNAHPSKVVLTFKHR